MKTWMTVACSLMAAAVFAEVPVITGNQNGAGAGFVKLTVAGGSETIVGVAFKDCMSVTAEITLNNLVSTTGLPSAASAGEADNAARLYVANGTSYLTYYNKTGDGWTKFGEGTDAGLTRTVGDAVWLIMPGTSSTSYNVYVKGELVTSQSVTVSPGLNLICAAKTEAYLLSALAVTSPNAGAKLMKSDYFLVPKIGEAASAKYYYDASASATQGTAVFRTSGSSPTYWTAATIPAGMGIWYYRSGDTSTTITLAVAGE